MRLGFVGYGNMAAALAGKWRSHELTIGGRDARKARALAEKVGGRAGDAAAAVDRAEAVVLATRHEHVFQAIEAAGGARAFAGKTVIDINNAVSTDTFLMQPMGAPSLAQAIQARLPEARVVKAFNTCQASVWEMDPPEFDGRRLIMPICGDAADAKATVAELAREMGVETLDVGGLQYAPHVEALAALTIQQLFGGADARSVFNWITPKG